MDSVDKRLAALAVKLKRLKGNPPPTFEQFQEAWQEMDGLSKSLIETGVACPSLIGGTAPYWDAVRNHLERMGATIPEPFTLDEILQSLESDDERY